MDENDVGIILLDRAGNPKEVYGKTVLRVPSTDGGTVAYSKAGSLVDKTVELDFCYGDMTIVPEEGELFATVHILQPKTLVPANIAAGAVVAGVPGAHKGGSGIEMPPGVYFRHADTKRLSKYKQAQCSLNGDIYLFTLPYTGNGNANDVYKLVDGEWVKIVTSYNINSGTPNASRFLEFNGRIHIIGADMTDHYAFDGTSISKLASLPNKIQNGAAFVFEDKLMAYSYYGGDIYEWDEASDSWSIYIDLPLTGTYNPYTPLVLDDRIYMYLNGKLCVVTGDSTLMEAGTSPASTFYAMTVHNNRAYGIAYGTANTAYDVYEFNPDGHLFYKIGKIPAATSSCWFWHHGNELRLFYGDNTAGFFDLIMNVVSE